MQTKPQELEIGKDVRLLAQAVALLAFAIAAAGAGWLMLNSEHWYVPTIALMVAARFGYDRFFA